MAWDDPGGSRDPWGGRKHEGPPDLDEVVKKLQARLSRVFGSGGSPHLGGGSYFTVVVVLIVVALFFECSYVIQAGQRGVVLRFGRHVATLQPGWSLRFPRPIEYVDKVNADLVQSTTHKAAMLTRDENIVDVELEVQYKIKDTQNGPADYLFNVRQPEDALNEATEAAVREIIGANTMDFVLTAGRSQIAEQTKEALQKILDDYGTGLVVNAINIKSAKPPEDVKAAFDDAIKAREDEQRLINEAEAYKNEIVPKARGAAARKIAEAEAYESQVVSRAEGDASRFTQLLTEYHKAPAVTRERMYLDTMQSVLNNTSKILLTGNTANQLIYLPLDKMMQQAGKGPAPAEKSATGSQSSDTPPVIVPDFRDRSDDRDRSRQ